MIRLWLVLAAVLLSVAAQAQVALDAQETQIIEVSDDVQALSQGSVLRIEETIRGTNEQPRVLSIVPWQVPLKQRIDKNEANWQPQTSVMQTIERSAFLSSLKVAEHIKE